MTSLISPKVSAKRVDQARKDDVDLPTTPKSLSAGNPPSSPTATLEAAIPLLVSQNLHDNQKGLEILMTLTKLTKVVAASRHEMCERIILQKHDPVARRIRTLLLSFLCDDVDIRASPEEADDDSLVSALSDVTYGLSHASTWEEDLDEFDIDRDYLSGRNWGALHFASLRFLVDCTQQLTRKNNKSTDIKIDYSSDFWRRMVETLSINIERTIPAKNCELSLRFLRLLIILDARAILPMVKYTMLPFILNLQDCGGDAKCPRVKAEAAKLMEVVMTTKHEI